MAEYDIKKEADPEINSVSSEAKGLSTNNAEKTVSRSISGASVGAMVGSLIVPGIGTAIGAAIGSLLGPLLNKMSVTARQESDKKGELP
jgi:uncharacterized membrane protein